jgi:hypothetical protein
VHLVTVALQNADAAVALTIFGVGSTITHLETCPDSTCGFTHIFSLAAGDQISLTEANVAIPPGSGGTIDTGSEITITRIA